MVSRVSSVAFEGVVARLIDVQCAVHPGTPSFSIVGLPDKTVSEARERIRSAMATLSIAMPARRVTVNLSPADLPKFGSHFDLPIAMALLVELDIVPREDLERTVALGELSLDGSLVFVPGVLAATMAAASENLAVLCPQSCGSEAAWVGGAEIIAAPGLGEIIRHYTGQSVLAPPRPGEVSPIGWSTDLSDVRGQERAKRALEIAAAGRHHLLLVGSPGSGKSMLAARLAGLLPPLAPLEALETSTIHSLAGQLSAGGISRQRPLREPHHTASVAAIVGGGREALPGEISLAHNGVLFMDEFPEFPRAVLETLRQPLETGEVMVARANAHVRYPCRFLLVAAANPCRCGFLQDASKACSQAPVCGADYLGRISGPLMDRFDLRVEVAQVPLADLQSAGTGESSAVVAARVLAARQFALARQPGVGVNADLQGKALEEVAGPDAEGSALIARLAERSILTARGYHRVLRVARTIADLARSDAVRAPHIAEAIGYRLARANTQRA